MQIFKTSQNIAIYQRLFILRTKSVSPNLCNIQFTCRTIPWWWINTPSTACCLPQLVQNDLANQEPMVTYLNEAVAELIEQGSGPSSSWREKQGEMNELYEAVCIMARDKQNRLQDTLKEVSHTQSFSLAHHSMLATCLWLEYCRAWFLELSFSRISESSTSYIFKKQVKTFLFKRAFSI